MAAKPIPLHKALRNLERQYGEKIVLLEQRDAEIAKLKQELSELKSCPSK